MCLSHFCTSHAKNTGTTWLATRPNVVFSARHTTLRCALRLFRKVKGTQQPNAPTVPRGIMPGALLALSGKGRPSGDRRSLKNDNTLFLLPQAPMSGERTKGKELPHLLRGRTHLPSRHRTPKRTRGRKVQTTLLQPWLCPQRQSQSRLKLCNQSQSRLKLCSPSQKGLSLHRQSLKRKRKAKIQKGRATKGSPPPRPCASLTRSSRGVRLYVRYHQHWDI